MSGKLTDMPGANCSIDTLVVCDSAVCYYQLLVLIATGFQSCIATYRFKWNPRSSQSETSAGLQPWG